MEQGLAIGLPFFLAFGGIALINWANGRKQNAPKKEKSAGYQISYNGTNFVWVHKDGNQYEGTLYFSDKPKSLTLTHGICAAIENRYEVLLNISRACDVKEMLQKFIEANW